MFIWSWKLRLPKLRKKWLMVGGAVVLSGVVVTALLLNLGGPPTDALSTAEASAPATEIKEATEVAATPKVETFDQRLSYLKQYGWLVQLDGEVQRTVTIPDTFDEVYTAFNDRQRAQGMDLEPYAGKTVTSYTYPILNYPDQEATVFAEILVRDGKVIGGEVYATGTTAFQHGLLFERPEARTEVEVSAPTGAAVDPVADAPTD